MCEGNQWNSVAIFYLKQKRNKYWPIKEVMLHDEQNVEQNGEEAQSEFGGVTEDRLPVI